MTPVVTKMIDRIKFSLFSPEMIRKISAAKITVPDTYNDDSYPIDGGLVDPRMGVIDPGLKCKTCGGKLRSCPGHFAHIELVRPVIHPEFAKVIFFVLKSTCYSCKRLLLSEKEIEELAAMIESEAEDELKTKTKRKQTHCPRCKAKIPEIKFIRPTSFYKDGQPMLPTEIRDWLAAIPDKDLRVLGLDPQYSRPEWMVLTALLVPPVSVRPSITLETGDRSEDDLTHKLVDIMRINQRLEANINAGAPQLIIEDLWELVQYHVTTYFNNETSNIPPARHRSGRPLKTLSQRLKGKEGRFRYNLSGKRVNFSARTVISPDPNISISEVGVPKQIAEELTVPIHVTSWNIEECKKFILSDSYPKAEYVVRPDGKRIRVTPQSRDEILSTFGIGYVVERQLMDGDIVLFNRQPSLHRISIMCHVVKVVPGKTFRLNPVVCPPYNADFDGDEMNLHVIQNEEARVEAEILMKVHNQIISPRHGHAIIKPQEDYVSGAYFFTKHDTEFTKSQACHLLAMAGITRLPAPDRKDKYSGKLLLSMLFPKELNIKVKSKLIKTKNPEDDPDALVVIKNGIMVSGALESRSYENEILEQIFHNRGAEEARWFLDTSTHMLLDVVSKHGLSVSLANYSISAEATAEINKLLEDMKREIEAAIVQYKNKTLERSPGLSLRESLEEKIMQITSRARDAAGAIVEKSMGYNNSALIMAKIGARGSILNAIQMAAMVGQQAVRSKRLSRGYRGRTLPHFKKNDYGAAARGFVFSSFKKGLSPTEFFHHSMGGRESLVNTAIRTARSGYMQRRLINALQDMVVAGDLSVRDSRGMICQFLYGGDGLDPIKANVKTEAPEEIKREEHEA
ncbi:MAG: DNA-directed RNA polymerase subunit A' [Candidatus Micrarchaeota archaeon]|nr:DNA-directed RNA polymerase subunit A' [Candidatus Micrarchaeota archaeon]